MSPRSLPAPRSSCFLFGPRGTGKSTWIRTTLQEAFTIEVDGTRVMPVESFLRRLHRGEVLG